MDDELIMDCPPQRRTIRVGWYNQEPCYKDGLIQYRKKTFRLWFPQTTFILNQSSWVRLFLLFNRNKFPLLPNVFPEGRVCLNISKFGEGDYSLDQIVELFWNTQFWSYENENCWQAARFVDKETEQPPFLRFFQQWEAWNLKQTEDNLQKIWDNPSQRMAPNRGFIRLVREINGEINV